MHKIRRTIRRRRKENKTDYKARFGMLKSKKPRVIFRKTNRYILGQIVVSDIAQDKVIISTNSKELLSHGWPEKMKGSLKGLGASYLTGYLLGTKSKEIREGILDIGLNRNAVKSKVFAFVKGLLDSGFLIPYNDESLPGDDLLMRKDELSKIIKLVKKKLEGELKHE